MTKLLVTPKKGKIVSSVRISLTHLIPYNVHKLKFSYVLFFIQEFSESFTKDFLLGFLIYEPVQVVVNCSYSNNEM
jgi:hypothetical protein